MGATVSISQHLHDLGTDKITSYTLGDNGHECEVIAIDNAHIFPETAEQCEAIADAATEAASRIRSRDRGVTDGPEDVSAIAIFVTTMHGDDRGADDARRRGDALLIFTDVADPGYVLRYGDDEWWISDTTGPGALTEAREILALVSAE